MVRKSRSIDSMNVLAVIVVGLVAVYLLALSAVLVVAPDRGKQFLSAFAQTRKAHVLEQGLRIVVGVAFMEASTEMRFSSIFYGFGWILCITSALLIILPWQWHQRFANLVVPRALEMSWLLALCAALAGLFLIYSFI